MPFSEESTVHIAQKVSKHGFKLPVHAANSKLESNQA